MNEKQDQGDVTKEVNRLVSYVDNSSDGAFRPDSDESVNDFSEDERISKISSKRNKEKNEQIETLKKKGKSNHVLGRKIYSKSDIAQSLLLAFARCYNKGKSARKKAKSQSGQLVTNIGTSQHPASPAKPVKRIAKKKLSGNATLKKRIPKISPAKKKQKLENKEAGILPEFEKLLFVNEDKSSGFFENFLNAIHHREFYSDLFQTVKRYLILTEDQINSTLSEYPMVMYKQFWDVYEKSPKKYMQLMECLTSYLFKNKYVAHEVEKDLTQDCIVLQKNSIYAFIFFREGIDKTYTIFVVNEKAYAVKYFDRAINLFGMFDKLKEKIKRDGFDRYDVFEFQVGHLSRETYGVKVEGITGEGTSMEPLVLSSDEED